LICWVFTSLLFTKLPISGAAYPYVFAILYFFAYWGYNLMWISYRSLMGVISRTPYDSVLLSTTGFQFGTLASLLFGYLGIKILTAYAGNPAIYGINAFGYCGIMVICVVVVSIATKAYDGGEKEEGLVKPRAKLKDLRHVFTGPMVPLFLSIALRSAVPVMISALLIYFLRLVIKDVAIMPVYVLIVSIVAFLGATLAKRLAKRIDKKRLYIVSGIVHVALLISIGFFGTTTVGFLILFSVNYFVMYIGSVLVPSFMNDVSEYNNHKHKTDIRAFTFSVGALSVNASQIIGSSIASFGLVLLGYDPHHEVSAATVEGIRYLMTFVPAALVLAGVGIFLFYKLDYTALDKLRESGE
jgi:Na+/melibiose symporter-like transporter